VPELPDLPVAIGPEQLPPPPTPPAPPPPPSTELAEATEVTGIIEVGGQTQIIAKAPNEPTVRYVNVGERIARGEVLIKGVENIEGADPQVILEQNGVEVIKPLGEQQLMEEEQNMANVARKTALLR
jgi:hypothetical protein